ncbi:hypothetical protein DFJ77DRAFT_463750 [Powellomyces hirtus]|nr:hypothetical protein DFJ77DRAFT_463750 [Powellomyces hirtus]
MEVLAESLPDPKERAAFVKLGREAIYKTYPISGMPRTINALSEFRAGALSNFPQEYAALSVALSEAASLEHPDTVASPVAERGQMFFNQVYGRTAPRLSAILSGLHPELLHVIINDAYGRILSDERVLPALETELVMVGALEVQGGPVAKQVESHRRGAVKLGASAEQVTAAEYIAQRVLANF